MGNFKSCPKKYNEEELCTICYKNRINCILMPCKHTMYCNACIKVWFKTIDNKIERILNEIIDKDITVNELPKRCCPYCYEEIKQIKLI